MSATTRPKDPKGTTIRVREDCDQLYFVYTGADRGVLINPAIFLTETGIFDRNLVIAQDPWNLYYQCGVSSELDSFDAFLEWQRDFRASLDHVSRVFCVGACMGGFAAIMFGHLLLVDEVWAFGAQTVVPHDMFRRRARAQAEVSQRIARGEILAQVRDPSKPSDPVRGKPPPPAIEIPPDRADLSVALKHSNGVTRYNLFYHAGYRDHAEAATRLAGCPNVRLRPEPGDGYNVVQTFLDRALLPTLLAPDHPTVPVARPHASAR